MTSSIFSKRRLAVGVLAVPAVLVLATACSSSSSGGGGGSSSSASSSSGSSAPASSGGSVSSSKAVTVDVKNFSFNPQNLTISTGTKVTWKFEDSADHNVTANDGTFKSTDLNDNKTFSYTFNKAGTYSYICTIHQYMTASITVK